MNGLHNCGSFSQWCSWAMAGSSLSTSQPDKMPRPTLVPLRHRKTAAYGLQVLAVAPIVADILYSGVNGIVKPQATRQSILAVLSVITGIVLLLACVLKRTRHLHELWHTRVELLYSVLLASLFQSVRQSSIPENALSVLFQAIWHHLIVTMLDQPLHHVLLSSLAVSPAYICSELRSASLSILDSRLPSELLMLVLLCRCTLAAAVPALLAAFLQVGLCTPRGNESAATLAAMHSALSAAEAATTSAPAAAAAAAAVIVTQISRSGVERGDSSSSVMFARRPVRQRYSASGREILAAFFGSLRAARLYVAAYGALVAAERRLHALLMKVSPRSLLVCGCGLLLSVSVLQQYARMVWCELGSCSMHMTAPEEVLVSMALCYLLGGLEFTSTTGLQLGRARRLLSDLLPAHLVDAMLLAEDPQQAHSPSSQPPTLERYGSLSGNESFKSFAQQRQQFRVSTSSGGRMAGSSGCSSSGAAVRMAEVPRPATAPPPMERQGNVVLYSHRSNPTFLSHTVRADSGGGRTDVVGGGGSTPRLGRSISLVSNKPVPMAEVAPHASLQQCHSCPRRRYVSDFGSAHEEGPHGGLSRSTTGGSNSFDVEDLIWLQQQRAAQRQQAAAMQQLLLHDPLTLVEGRETDDGRESAASGKGEDSGACLRVDGDCDSASAVLDVSMCLFPSEVDVLFAKSDVGDGSCQFTNSESQQQDDMQEAQMQMAREADAEEVLYIGSFQDMAGVVSERSDGSGLFGHGDGSGEMLTIHEGSAVFAAGGRTSSDTLRSCADGKAGGGAVGGSGGDIGGVSRAGSLVCGSASDFDSARPSWQEDAVQAQADSAGDDVGYGQSATVPVPDSDDEEGQGHQLRRQNCKVHLSAHIPVTEKGIYALLGSSPGSAPCTGALATAPASTSAALSPTHLKASGLMHSSASTPAPSTRRAGLASRASQLVLRPGCIRLGVTSGTDADPVVLSRTTSADAATRPGPAAATAAGSAAADGGARPLRIASAGAIPSSAVPQFSRPGVPTVPVARGVCSNPPSASISACPLPPPAPRLPPPAPTQLPAALSLGLNFAQPSLSSPNLPGPSTPAAAKRKASSPRPVPPTSHPPPRQVLAASDVLHGVHGVHAAAAHGLHGNHDGGGAAPVCFPTVIAAAAAPGRGGSADGGVGAAFAAGATALASTLVTAAAAIVPTADGVWKGLPTSSTPVPSGLSSPPPRASHKRPTRNATISHLPNILARSLPLPTVSFRRWAGDSNSGACETFLDNAQGGNESCSGGGGGSADGAPPTVAGDGRWPSLLRGSPGTSSTGLPEEQTSPFGFMDAAVAAAMAAAVAAGVPLGFPNTTGKGGSGGGSRPISVARSTSYTDVQLGAAGIHAMSGSGSAVGSLPASVAAGAMRISLASKRSSVSSALGGDDSAGMSPRTSSTANLMVGVFSELSSRTRRGLLSLRPAGPLPSDTGTLPLSPYARQESTSLHTSSNHSSGAATTGSSYAEAHESVTVLFADVVSFTSLADQVDPVDVMTMINELFTRFDDLTTLLPVYKIETVGDCYVCATGLLHDDPDHAYTMVQFALAMRDAARTVQLPNGGGPVQLRIGMHSGRVLSGLVGKIRRKYCLFGDTMNVSARMEAASRPGHINLSAATYALACTAPGLQWTARGPIQIKGKGHMECYFVESAY